MTSAARYNIVLAGKFAQGVDPAAAKQHLAKLFKIDAARIERFFNGQPTVIGKNMDAETAGRYVKTLRSAGALCRAEEAAPAPVPPAPLQPAAPIPQQPQTIAYQLGTSELAYAPILTNRITAGSGCINFNRPDMQAVPYADIDLLSVFCRTPQESSKVLFFLHGRSRPYMNEADRINYGDFPGVRGDNIISSLRNFITFLCAQNPAMVLDRPTRTFLNGKEPMVFVYDVALLATALGKALQAQAGSGC